jgi:TPR repeat protein
MAHAVRKTFQKLVHHCTHATTHVLKWKDDIERSFVDIVEWFKKAASHPDAVGEAENELGNLFQLGQGVEKDDKVSFEWYTKGTERGNAIAAYNLALSYRWARGVAMDKETALKYLIKSADGGYINAMLQVGVYYREVMRNFGRCFACFSHE